MNVSRNSGSKPDFAVTGHKADSVNWERPTDVKSSYKGHKPIFKERVAPKLVNGKMTKVKYNGVDEPHPLEVPYKRQPCLGYSGYLPHASTMTGGPSHLGPKEEEEEPEWQSGGLVSNFRQYAKNMDTVERYTTAVEQLKERGQTQVMLIRLVQNKLAERVKSYAEQKITTRLLFEAHDVNRDYVLDEFEFRICLEKVNVQLDDVQSLALFAYFDTDFGGSINWQEFSEQVMVANPKGGNAILPKPITASLSTGMWHDVMDQGPYTDVKLGGAI
jgi:hypothetical protein